MPTDFLITILARAPGSQFGAKDPKLTALLDQAGQLSDPAARRGNRHHAHEIGDSVVGLFVDCGGPPGQKAVRPGRAEPSVWGLWRRTENWRLAKMVIQEVRRTGSLRPTEQWQFQLTGGRRSQIRTGFHNLDFSFDADLLKLRLEVLRHDAGLRQINAHDITIGQGGLMAA